MIGVYRALTSLIYSVAKPFWAYRAKRGSRLWQGRLLHDLPELPVDIWLHAASAGETRMIAILVSHLLRLDDGLRIHLTVMTEAGYQTAGQVVPDTVTRSYFPLDMPVLVREFVDRLRPRVIGVAETEIWPNMVFAARDRQIPMVLINGRMSQRAFGRYRKVAGSLARLLRAYEHLYLRSEADRQRFATFGISPDQATVLGDMKFDAPLQPCSEGRIREIRYRAKVLESAPLLVAGSTRPGEEALVLDCVGDLWADHPELHLILAPRHLDRLDEVSALLSSRGIAFSRYGDEKSDPCRVILVDRMGLLNDLYLAANIAFVGGTLVDIGGHNVLEPVWAGTPVLFGPHIANVTEAAAYIQQHSYGAQVADTEAMTIVLKEFLAGRRTFAKKTEADLAASPTAEAARHIIGLLKREVAADA